MIRRACSALLVAAVTVTLGAGLAAGRVADASPAPVSGGPTVVLSDAVLDVGGTLYSEWDSDADNYAEWVVPMTLHWTATAPAGICAQTITERGYEWLGGDVDPILGSNTGTTPLTAQDRQYAAAQEYFDYYRGGYAAVVRATDCDGTTAASGIATAQVGLREDTSPSLSWTGKWKISTCACASGLSRHYSRKRHSSVTFATTPSTGNDVGLVMAKGPTRGQAKVYVDGVKVTTLHTYARTAVSKAVTWQMQFTDGISHVIKVVNRATTGHSRIDLDVVVN